MTEPNADQFFLELADMSRKLLVLADDNAAMLQTPEQKAAILVLHSRVMEVVASMDGSPSFRHVVSTIVFAMSLAAILHNVSVQGLSGKIGSDDTETQSAIRENGS